MGREKAAIVIGGSTLLERAVTALRLAGAKRIAIVGLATTSAFAARAWPSDVVLVADSEAHLGPLRAIIDGLVALGRSPHTVGPTDDGICTVMACDHPEPDPLELLMLAERLQHEPLETLAAVPIVDGRTQPLHAAYRWASAEPLEEHFRQGERSIARALEQLHAVNGRFVLMIERGQGRSARSYVDLDDVTELATYQARNGETTPGAGSLGGTSG